MDAIELNYRLKRAGHTQVSLARELGVTRGVVNDVVHGRKSAFRVATRVADAVGVDVDVLWPGRYRQESLSHHPINNRAQ
ncbi:helix-turn-helix domain-containing protein [Advenella sp. FME57]|uniref:helix-turn-helix domain-containing protein n=1 Tax=Advenella sp. FME57 TaxID=2742604 RepID=UPI001866496A